MNKLEFANVCDVCSTEREFFLNFKAQVDEEVVNETTLVLTPLTVRELLSVLDKQIQIYNLKPGVNKI